MTVPDLLPCPFCGGEAEIWRAHEGRTAWVACMGRCAVLVSKEYTTDAEAIAAWNTRATPAPAAIRDDVADLADFLDAKHKSYMAGLGRNPADYVSGYSTARDKARAILAALRAGGVA